MKSLDAGNPVDDTLLCRSHGVVVILIHIFILFIFSIMSFHLAAVLLSLHLSGDLFAPSKISGAHLLHILGCTSASEAASVDPVSSSDREINT